MAQGKIAAALESLQLIYEQMQTSLEAAEVVEQALLQQNQQVTAAYHRYYDLFQNSPIAYLITDTDGVILEANSAIAQLLNVPAIATVAQTALAKGIDLVWQETIADRDTDRSNCFLTNAIKFTPESGSVTVELSVINDHNSPNASTAQIRVVDTGIGFAADFLPHVFERFRQAEGSTSVKGLGLGLA